MSRPVRAAVPGVRSAWSSRLLPWTGSEVVLFATRVLGRRVRAPRSVVSSPTGRWISWTLPFTVFREGWRGEGVGAAPRGGGDGHGMVVQSATGADSENLD